MGLKLREQLKTVARLASHGSNHVHVYAHDYDIVHKTYYLPSFYEVNNKSTVVTVYDRFMKFIRRTIVPLTASREKKEGSSDFGSHYLHIRKYKARFDRGF